MRFLFLFFSSGLADSESSPGLQENTDSPDLGNAPVICNPCPHLRGTVGDSRAKARSKNNVSELLCVSVSKVNQHGERNLTVPLLLPLL